MSNLYYHNWHKTCESEQPGRVTFPSQVACPPGFLLLSRPSQHERGPCENQVSDMQIKVGLLQEFHRYMEVSGLRQRKPDSYRASERKLDNQKLVLQNSHMKPAINKTEPLSLSLGPTFAGFFPAECSFLQNQGVPTHNSYPSLPHSHPLGKKIYVITSSHLAKDTLKTPFPFVLEPFQKPFSHFHNFSFFAGVCHCCKPARNHREKTAQSTPVEGRGGSFVALNRSIQCGLRGNTLRQQASRSDLPRFPALGLSPKDPARTNGMAGEATQAQPGRTGTMAASIGGRYEH